jgi:uncharacterized phage protein (TIGR01671 family)
MREYLFRAREIKTKKWVYGGFHEHQPSVTAIGKQPETEALIITDGFSDWNLPIPIEAHVVEKETVGQYTGLKDRDAKRIFEGDIVKDEFGNIGVVRYSDHFLDWRIHFYKGRPDLVDCKEYGVRMFDWVYQKILLEVIGNIHDAPELLGREKDNA